MKTLFLAALCLFCAPPAFAGPTHHAEVILHSEMSRFVKLVDSSVVQSFEQSA